MKGCAYLGGLGSTVSPSRDRRTLACSDVRRRGIQTMRAQCRCSVCDRVSVVHHACGTRHTSTIRRSRERSGAALPCRREEVLKTRLKTRRSRTVGADGDWRRGWPCRLHLRRELVSARRGDGRTEHDGAVPVQIGEKGDRNKGVRKGDGKEVAEVADASTCQRVAGPRHVDFVTRSVPRPSS